MPPESPEWPAARKRLVQHVLLGLRVDRAISVVSFWYSSEENSHCAMLGGVPPATALFMASAAFFSDSTAPSSERAQRVLNGLGEAPGGQVLDRRRCGQALRDRIDLDCHHTPFSVGKGLSKRTSRTTAGAGEFHRPAIGWAAWAAGESSCARKRRPSREEPRPRRLPERRCRAHGIHPAGRTRPAAGTATPRSATHQSQVCARPANSANPVAVVTKSWSVVPDTAAL